jgi:putative tryptophan/tyrosine transport system substrate-binding protein
MRRRDFIKGIVGSATVWPLAADAQQQHGGLPRIAFLHAIAEHDPEIQARIEAFRQELEALGWVENRNIQISHWFSGGDFAQMQANAAQVVSSAPEIITASSTPVMAALKQATQTIPIVFSVVIDPVGQGLVASLAHPGGNITGFTFVDFPIIGKWMELLKAIAPGVRRITILFNSRTAPWVPNFVREFGATASLSVELSQAPVHDETEIETAVTAVARTPDTGLIAAPDAFMNQHRGLVITLAQRHHLPAIYGYRQFPTEGALMSYGPDTADIVRRSASYVDRILRGEKPADLPVQAPTKYQLVINLKTAKALGLTVPLTLQASAEEVIE